MKAFPKRGWMWSYACGWAGGGWPASIPPTRFCATMAPCPAWPRPDRGTSAGPTMDCGIRSSGAIPISAPTMTFPPPCPSSPPHRTRPSGAILSFSLNAMDAGAWSLFSSLPSRWVKIGAFVSRRSVRPKHKKGSAVLNCTPFVRQYGILKNKRGALLCQKEYQTNDIHQNSKRL